MCYPSLDNTLPQQVCRGHDEFLAEVPINVEHCSGKLVA
jgi:hypothetical protein